ncbi:MAG: MgtC/SapB family protein [Sedimentisphaerales bacterium]|nr:MgtC/SapB family protein [Sedimentisphaerales bacterium]
MLTWQVHLLRLLLAGIFGAAIGLERQLHGKVAGVRTNLLICLGAAVLTLVSEQMGLRYDDSVGRIAAQIVSGVGFLGAGVIIRDRGGIHGLTTAATIWLVAAVGMAVGAGFYFLSVCATVIAVAVLTGLRNWPTRPADHAR